MLFVRPQIHQNQQQQKFHHLWHRPSHPRGVAKVRFGLPMLHGKRCVSASHAAWEGENSFLRHLSSGKVLLFISVTRPQREAWKWWRCRVWIIASTSCVNFRPFPIIIFQPIPIIKKLKPFFYFLKLNFWQNYKILFFFISTKTFLY